MPKTTMHEALHFNDPTSTPVTGTYLRRVRQTRDAPRVVRTTGRVSQGESRRAAATCYSPKTNNMV